MTLSADDDRAPFEQVASALRAGIESGALPVGSKVPSIRNLAKEYGVAPGTAQAAIDLLRSQNYVYAVAGRGTFVRERQGDEQPAVTPEVAVLAKHLNSLDATVRELAERLERLERQAPDGRTTV